MFDTNLLKEDSRAVAQKLKSRNYELNYELYDSLEDDRKKFQIQAEDLQAKRNNYSKDYGKIKELALKDKQLRTIEKWMKEKIEDTYVSINRSFRECDYSNNWLKL